MSDADDDDDDDDEEGRRRNPRDTASLSRVGTARSTNTDQCLESKHCVVRMRLEYGEQIEQRPEAKGIRSYTAMNDAETDQEARKKLVGSLAEKKLLLKDALEGMGNGSSQRNPRATSALTQILSRPDLGSNSRSPDGRTTRMDSGTYAAVARLTTSCIKSWVFRTFTDIQNKFVVKGGLRLGYYLYHNRQQSKLKSCDSFFPRSYEDFEKY
ncbi:hypothetical protein ANN_10083 [Periplaneta americana]|uniref:Uncharacterized protein n=1 Tax=Periplaneta americana TaxID=6978 RepID=A0ABQ8TPK2_PERAM|nr:hypothetical protein ANN_10083 [Periplaneta americana]